MFRGATISPCLKYRYELHRKWSDGGKYVAFIGLNPSTADANKDDPTIRRCIGFAKAWKFKGLIMANLFAYRATDPKDMKAASDPVGIDNNIFLDRVARDAGLVIAAWGVHGTHLGRDQEVRKLLPRLHHLGLTKDGHPKHPLYLKGDTVPTLWESATAKETM